MSRKNQIGSMHVHYDARTAEQIVAVIAERPGVLHFHIARELGLKARELDDWLRTVGTKDHQLLHHGERWWTNDPRWIEPTGLRRSENGLRQALDQHRDNYMNTKEER